MNPAIDLINSHWNPGSWTPAKPPVKPPVNYPRVQALDSNRVRVQWEQPPKPLREEVTRYPVTNASRIAEYEQELAASRTDVDLEILLEAAIKALSLEPQLREIGRRDEAIRKFQASIDELKAQRDAVIRDSVR